MEILIDGLRVTIIGMSIVFVILIFISIIIGFFKYLNVFEKKQNPEVLLKDTTIDKKEDIVEIKKEDVTDNLELVAVITSAIASSLNTSTDQLRVKSIKRVQSLRNRWHTIS